MIPAEEFLNRFVNNRNAYATQNSNGSYTAHRNQSITMELFEQHLLGELTLGVYAINPDNNTSKFLCWDIDNEAEENIANLVQWLADFNIRIIRASRRPGRSGHLYVFLRQPILSSEAFRILKHGQFLWQIPGEVFPAQAGLKIGQVGSLVRLELGVHRKPSAGGIRGLFEECPSNDIVQQLLWFNRQPLNDVTKLLDSIPKTAQISGSRCRKQHKNPGQLVAEFPDWDWLVQPSGELLGRCPKCAEEGHDLKHNNLSLNPETNVLYCHYSGGIHTFQQILRSARNFTKLNKLPV